MKFSFVLFSAFLIINTSFSQQVFWSAPVKSESKMKYLKIIGSIGDQFYLLQSNYPFQGSRNKMTTRSQRYSLSCYSMNMTLNWTKALQVSQSGGRIFDVQITNDRLLLAYYETTKNNFTHFYFQYLNEFGNFESNAIHVDSISSRLVETSRDPHIIASKDETLLALLYLLVPDEMHQQKLRMTIVTDTLIKSSLKEMIVNSDGHFFDPVDIAISDSGDIHLLEFRNISEKKTIFPGDAYFELHSYWNKENKITNSDIRIPEKLLTDAGLAIDNLNNTVVVAGFYSDKTIYSTAGIFFYSKKPGEILTEELKSTAFNENFLKKFISEKKENDKELINYSIDRILLRKDGGIVMVAESFSSTSRSYYDYFTQSLISHTYYHYGNIISLSVNTDGGFLWNNILSKDQNSTDDEGYLSSYCSIVNNSKMYFVYNKYIESKSSIMLSSLTGKGEQNTSVLFNQLDNIIVVPKAGMQVEQNILLLPAYKDNQFCLLKIIF